MKAVEFVTDKFWGVIFAVADRLPKNFIYRYILYSILAATGCCLITYLVNPANVLWNCLILMIVSGVLLLLVYSIIAFTDEDYRRTCQKLMPVSVATIVYALLQNYYETAFVAALFLVMTMTVALKKGMIARTLSALLLQVMLLVTSYFLIVKTKNAVDWLFNLLKDAFPHLD